MRSRPSTWNLARTCLVVGLCTGCLGAAPLAAAAGPTATPTLTPLPVTATSQPFGAAIGLAANHYVEEELVVSGTANVYEHDGNGAIVVKTPDVPYAARMIVRRPCNPHKFNGTVVFELLNATPGFDTDILWLYTRDLLMREGYAYVGLSNTVEANAFSKNWDPVRYADLGVVTFGQTWDMAAQVAVLLKDAQSPQNPLAGYPVRSILGGGHSASGRFWRTVAMVHHEAALLPDGRHALDGYLLTGHRVPPVPLNSAEAPYTDDRRLVLVNAPVIRIQTETEVSPAPFAPTESVEVVRQADSSVFRMYEVAGTSHADEDFIKLAFGPGSALLRDLPGFVSPPCVNPLNPLGFQPYVRMALHHLNRWVNAGVVPPPGLFIDYTTDPPPAGGSVRDGFGNATGGIRPPQLEVPIGQYLPFNPPAVPSPPLTFFCSLTGSYLAFDEATLPALYPTHGSYVHQFVQAVNRIVHDGYLLPEDGAAMKAEAARSSAGRP